MKTELNADKKTTRCTFEDGSWWEIRTFQNFVTGCRIQIIRAGFWQFAREDPSGKLDLSQRLSPDRWEELWAKIQPVRLAGATVAWSVDAKITEAAVETDWPEEQVLAVWEELMRLHVKSTEEKVAELKKA